MYRFTTSFFSLFAVLAIGCSSTPPTNTGDADPQVDTGNHPTGCTSNIDCDDHFSCTVDTCLSGGTCTHAIGPNTGATACSLGSYCTVDKGCLASTVCAKDADCPTGDACKANMHCDLSSSLCIWDVLDKDRDGHPPIVCGGDDCNDNDSSVYPGAPEVCNGKDDNCDGIVDNGATCPDAVNSCQMGLCACKPENHCGASSACVDFSVNPNHCGGCSNVCDSASTCKSGVCDCAASLKCGGVCKDLMNDASNCGTCGTVCTSGLSCIGGACRCPSSTQQLCGSTCVNTYADTSNCGMCGNACLGGTTCVSGSCTCTGTVCGSICADVHSDPNNCGKCSTVCPSGVCNGGRC